MNLLAIDFETYWAADYSLSCMPALEYVMDPRFEIISCALAHGDGGTRIAFGQQDTADLLHDLRTEISDSLLIAHNMTGFDAYILKYRLGIQPKMWGDTLAMARPLHAKTCGLSLASLVKHYNIGVKNNAALLQTKGKHLADFTREERKEMAIYNRDDAAQCVKLFHKLRKHITASEMWQIDAIVRMRTEPQLMLDTPLLHHTRAAVRADMRHALLDLASQLGTAPSDSEDETVENMRATLASAPRFAAMLTALGVDPPTKPSPADPTKTIPALAKTDEGMKELLDHPDPIVAAAASVRLGVKSTQLETRVERFLSTAWCLDGMMPVPLRYCGADTTGRDSGDDGLNMQNLPRITPGSPKRSDALRLSLMAPPGKAIIVADQSGIELRVNHFLWKVQSSMDLYKASPDKADLYRAFAATYYNKPAEEITKPERQFAKVMQLGLGFGSGAATFQRIARTMSGLNIALDQATTAVKTWRATYNDIVDGWNAASEALSLIHAGKEAAIDPWGLTHTCCAGITLPSGRLIRYPELRYEESDQTWPDGRVRKQWVYAYGKHKAWLHGPKVVENIVQALARDSIFDCALEYYRRTGLRPALRVHDELVYVVDKPKADELLAELQTVMRTPPPWWPELIVSSEGAVARRYGEAK